jgi:hypothetical protein
MLIAFIPGICTGAAAGTEPLTAPASGAVFRIPPTGLAYRYRISPRTELLGPWFGDRDLFAKCSLIDAFGCLAVSLLAKDVDAA